MNFSIDWKPRWIGLYSRLVGNGGKFSGDSSARGTTWFKSLGGRDILLFSYEGRETRNFADSSITPVKGRGKRPIANPRFSRVAALWGRRSHRLNPGGSGGITSQSCQSSGRKTAILAARTRLQLA
jgi:hypothetical protein